MADEKDAAAETAEPQEAEQAQDGKTYTAEELKAEADRRASKAAETARKNAIAEYEKKLEDEKRKAEAKRLEEQGEYKTIAEQTQAELDALKSQLAERERRETIANGLRDAGLSEFGAVLLADRDNPEKFIEAAKGLQDLLKLRVDEEVKRRLDTGTKAAATNATGRQSSGPDLKSLYPDMFRETA